MPRATILLSGLLLAFLAGERCHAQVEKLDGDRLLDPSRLLQIRITIKDDDWDALRRQQRHGASFFAGAPIDDPFTWFSADIKIDGTVVRKVGLRKKGLFGSMDSERPSLRIKFNEFVDQDPVEGLDRLTLNNNKQDTSQVSQYLTYKLFRDAGVRAPRSSFAWVMVNGEDLGIYSNVESINKPFLKRAFGDDSGNLYEGTLTDFHPRTLENFSVKTHKSTNDRSDISRIAELFSGTEPLSLTEVEKVLDVEGFLRFWALEAMVQFWDGYSGNQNNFYFYVEPGNGRGSFIPWGADSCWSGRGFRSGAPGSTAIYSKSILCNRLYHTDNLADRYRDTLTRLLDEVWKEADLIAEIDRVEKLVRSHLHSTQKHTDDAMVVIREFISKRRARLVAELVRWPPSVPKEPVLPTYTVPLGSLRGTFSTKWDEKQSDEPTRVGKAALDVTMNGAPVAFKRLGVSAYEYRAPPGFGGGFGPAAPPRVSLAIAGARESDGEVLSFVISVDQSAFEAATGEPIPVTGNFRRGDESRAGGPGNGPRTSVFGEVRFTRAGIKRGQKVEGDLDLTVAEVHGGG